MSPHTASGAEGADGEAEGLTSVVPGGPSQRSVPGAIQVDEVEDVQPEAPAKVRVSALESPITWDKMRLPSPGSKSSKELSHHSTRRLSKTLRASTRSFSHAHQPIVMFHDKHLFVELHEFSDGHWQETRRWNHGLRQALSASKEKTDVSLGRRFWLSPQLPSISLHGLSWVRDALRPEMVLLDLPGGERPLEHLAEMIVERLLQRPDGGCSERARNGFMQKLCPERQCEVAIAKKLASPTKSYDDGEASPGSPTKSFKDGHQEAWTEDTCGALPSSLLASIPSSDTQPSQGMFRPDGDLELDEDDPLQPEVEQEVVQILADSVDWLDQDMCVIARFKEAVKTGLEEVSEDRDSRARFLVLCLTTKRRSTVATWARHRPRHIEMGEAIATVFQDDRIVSAMYTGIEAKEILSAFEYVFENLKIMPNARVPKEQAIKKRAQRMLHQMTNIQHNKSLDQGDRWLLQQRDAFSNGISMDSIMHFLQKFAIPLLTGIVLALLLANTAPEDYDYWTGSGPAYSDEHRRLGGGGGGHRPTFFDISVKGHPVTLNFIVNDIFMCLFFGLAGKEITEALQPGGSLYPPTRTTVNVLAATLGGVLGPVSAYLALVGVSYSSGLLDKEYSMAEYMEGWGVPTATDISLAWVTALCVFGAGHPAINYLLLLAIIDDGIGLMIIAFAYPDPHNPLQPIWLLLVLAAMVVSLALRLFNCGRWEIYVALAGPLSWFGLLGTGLHPSLALVFVVPFIPKCVENDRLDSFLSGQDSEMDGEHSGKHPLHDFEDSVKDFVDFGVLFSFGAVNAGVSLDGAGMLTVIVLLSLVVGKTLGILLMSMIATCLGCPPPAGMQSTTVAAVGFIASAGLTVALFVSGQAFSETPVLAGQAKMGALLSVLVAFAAVSFKKLQDRLVPPALKRRDSRPGSSGSQNGTQRTSSLTSNFDEDEVAMEDMLVQTTLRNLKLIHAAEHAIECRTNVRRADALKMYRGGNR